MWLSIIDIVISIIVFINNITDDIRKLEKRIKLTNDEIEDIKYERYIEKLKALWCVIENFVVKYKDTNIYFLAPTDTYYSNKKLEEAIKKVKELKRFEDLQNNK